MPGNSCDIMISAANDFCKKEEYMKIRKKFLDYEYEEVLDVRTRELIRVACAVAVGCPD